MAALFAKLEEQAARQKQFSTVSKVGNWNSRLFCVGSKPRN